MLTPVSHLNISKIRKAIQLASLQGRWRTDQGVLNLSSGAPSDGEGVLSWEAMEGSIGGKLERNTGWGLNNYLYETGEQNGHALLKATTDPYTYWSENGGWGSSTGQTWIFVAQMDEQTGYLTAEPGGALIRTGPGTSGKMLLAANGVTINTVATGLFGSLSLYVFGFSDQANGALARKDGVDYPLDGDFDGQTFGTPDFTIGQRPGVPEEFASGWGEILVYDEALTLAQIEAIETELNDYWSIY